MASIRKRGETYTITAYMGYDEQGRLGGQHIGGEHHHVALFAVHCDVDRLFLVGGSLRHCEKSQDESKKQMSHHE